MDDLINNKHDILQVVEDHFPCVWTFCDYLQNLGDGIYHLFHEDKILIVGCDQVYLQFIDELEENRVGIQGEYFS